MPQCVSTLPLGLGDAVLTQLRSFLQREYVIIIFATTKETFAFAAALFDVFKVFEVYLVGHVNVESGPPSQKSSKMKLSEF